MICHLTFYYLDLTQRELKQKSTTTRLDRIQLDSNLLCNVVESLLRPTPSSFPSFLTQSKVTFGMSHQRWPVPIPHLRIVSPNLDLASVTDPGLVPVHQTLSPPASSSRSIGA